MVIGIDEDEDAVVFALKSGDKGCKVNQDLFARVRGWM